MRGGLGGDGFHRKRGADVRSRVDHEAAVGRPRRIDRVFVDERRRERPSIGTRKRRGTPRSSTADVIDWPSGAQAGAPRSASESATIRAFVPSACMTYKKVCPPSGPKRRSAAVAGDRRPAEDSRSGASPQLGGRSVGEFPDTLAGAGRRDIQEVVGPSRGENPLPVVSEIGAAADTSAANLRSAGARASPSDSRASPPGAGRQRWRRATCIGRGRSSAGVEYGARHPCCGATVPSHPDRSRGTERPPIQQHRMTHASVVRRDPLGGPPAGPMRQMSSWSGQRP